MESLLTYQRRQQILSMIPKGGISVAQLAKLLDANHSSIGERLREYMLKGYVYVARAKVDGATTVEAWYFKDQDECTEFREFWAQKVLERRKEHNRGGWSRAKPEAKQRCKAKVKAKRALGKLAKVKGTYSPKVMAVPVVEVSNPNNVQPTILGNQLRGRFEAEAAPPCFSALRPGQYIAPPSKWVEAVA